MPKRRLIIVLAGLCLAGLLAIPFLFIVFQDALFNETETRFYRSLTEATAEIQRGWIPSSLPGSAHDIREKLNIDYNTVILQFSFEPREFPIAFPHMSPVPGERARAVSPHWIVWRSDWIPKAIKRGRADELLTDGFELYRADEKIHTRAWYFLIHKERGVAYAWNSNNG